MKSSNSYKTAPNLLKVEKTQSNTAKKSPHPLLKPFIAFWRFSRYYAQYKARIRGY